MKINNSDAVNRLKGALDRIEDGERASRTDTRSGRVAGGQGRADQVQVSARAREIQQLREAVAASPEVRQELVDKLREEIASGRYRIDGTRIADELLKEN